MTSTDRKLIDLWKDISMEQHETPRHECENTQSFYVQSLSFPPTYSFVFFRSFVGFLFLDAEKCVRFRKIPTLCHIKNLNVKKLDRFVNFFYDFVFVSQVCDTFLVHLHHPSLFRPNPNPACFLISVWPSWQRQGHSNVSFPGM